MKRRHLLAGLSLVPALPLRAWALESPAREPGFAALIEEARARAAAPYAPPSAPAQLPAELPAAIHRRARVRPQHLRDLGAGYVLAPLPPGGPPPAAVPVRLLRGSALYPVAFRPGMFDEPDLVYPPGLPLDTGFGGIALFFPLNRPPALDEFLRFGRASLIRGTCRDGVIGPTARGVAVDTSSGRGEEFPAFVEYRIGQPDPVRRELPIFALLDGPSLAGAYAFSLRAGIETVVEVRAVLFLRESGRQIGLAPIGGMFLYGPQDPPAEAEVRPRIHDCAGLVIHRGDGERVWRALANPRAARLSVFRDDNPRGFGLVQRIRDPAAYGDPVARYERSPDLWVEPLHPWGRGSLHLVEIPVDNPGFSNIVVFWEPENLPEPQKPLVAAWRLRWSLDATPAAGLLRVRETRVGRARSADGQVLPQRTAVEIDFEPAVVGDALLELEVGVNGGEASGIRSWPLDSPAGLRVSFLVEAAGSGPIELRCALRQQGRAISETWLGRLDAL
ncbi:Glucans biosynthesis protein G [bacterium HR40]|nr:Glucans biosynthesis protein G [bacterium HR40]